jgi:hypothetical protein
VVTLRGPRIRAPPNVIETLIRCHFKRPPGAASGRNTKLEEQRDTSIAIPSCSDLDCVSIAPLPTVPTVRSSLSFGVRRSSRNITQFNLRMTTRPFPSYGITTADLTPMKGGDGVTGGVLLHQNSFAHHVQMPFRRETWSVTGFRDRWMVTRGRAGLAGRSV